MSQPTASSIFTVAQSLVGDAAGSVATTAALLPFWTGIVYPELYQALARVQVPQVQREFYYTVPEYQTYLDPVAIGITDMGNPTLMEERAPGTLLPPITSTSNTTPIVVEFSAAHNLSSNSEIEVNDVDGTVAPWGRWFVTVVDATHASLNGSVTDGTAGTGGTAYLSSGQGFTPVAAATIWEPDNYQMGSSLGMYFWQGGVFKFVGASAPSQIHVTYWASGTAPSNLATPLMDDCQTYAATRLAGLFAESKGWYAMADRWKLQALGRNGTPDGRDGLLRNFVLAQIRSIQRGSIQRQFFRPRGPIFPVAGVSGLIGGFQGGGGVYFNFSNSNTQEYTLTTDISLAVPNGLVPNIAFWVIFIQDATGGHSVTLSGSQWSSSIDPTQWSGPGVAGNTRVVIPLVMQPSGQIILNGVISGPTAI